MKVVCFVARWIPFGTYVAVVLITIKTARYITRVHVSLPHYASDAETPRYVARINNTYVRA